ncbi:MAG: polysaccharide deacetylase family protein [Clostridia bacterium]|nr:polysaccharide deacetylase family protein [Clostridia bacterium]
MVQTVYRFMRFPGGKTKALATSYDDGVGTDLRLMDIFRKNGIKGTFNINACFTPEEDADVEKHPTSRLSLSQIKTFYKDMEIATHGAGHPFYHDLPVSAVTTDLIRDREILEKTFGKIIRGHAIPNSQFDSDTLMAMKAAGIIYARTGGNSESFTIPESFLPYYPTSHHNNPNLSTLIDRFLGDGTYICSPKFFCLWGHSFEFEQHGNWQHMEEVCRKLGNREDVFYGGMEEIFTYTAAFRSLVYSMDGKTVYNPTSYTLWMDLDVYHKKTVSILPGQTLTLD